MHQVPARVVGELHLTHRNYDLYESRAWWGIKLWCWVFGHKPVRTQFWNYGGIRYWHCECSRCHKFPCAELPDADPTNPYT
jgi:hypothetical protein